MILKLLGSTLLIYVVIILYTRLAGLRTFAKMSSFDFATTIAIGTVIGSSILHPDQLLWRGVFVLAILIALQIFIAVLKQKSDAFRELTTNEPLLLMKNGKVLYENLEKANMTKNDLIAKLREANVIQMSEVHAVVFETTGDVSVLHSDQDQKLDDILLSDVSEGNAL